jgi:hypothetical protein
MAPKDRRLTLPQAADRLQWSVRHLKSRLAAHSILPIGRGRAARLTEDDFKQLEAKERQPCRTSSSRRDGEAIIGISAARTPKAVSSILRGRKLAAALRRGQRLSSSSGPVIAFPGHPKP